MPFRIVPFLVLGFAAVEIVVAIFVAKATGVLAMLLLLVLATVAGVVLLRRTGFRAVARIREDVNSGRAPAAAFADAALLFVAGILLILPGFVTDAIALLLLIPAVRAGIWLAFATRLRSFFEAGFSGAGWQRWPGAPSSGPVLVTDVTIEPDPPRHG